MERQGRYTEGYRNRDSQRERDRQRDRQRDKKKETERLALYIREIKKNTFFFSLLFILVSKKEFIFLKMVFKSVTNKRWNLILFKRIRERDRQTDRQREKDIDNEGVQKIIH